MMCDPQKSQNCTDGDVDAQALSLSSCPRYDDDDFNQYVRLLYHVYIELIRDAPPGSGRLKHAGILYDGFFKFTKIPEKGESDV